MKAIIAFEVEVMEIDNVFKLSQNRDEESFHNIIAQLQIVVQMQIILRMK